MKSKLLLKWLLIIILIFYLYQQTVFITISLYSHIFYHDSKEIFSDFAISINPLNVFFYSIFFWQLTISNFLILMLYFIARPISQNNNNLLINYAIFLISILLIYILNIITVDRLVPMEDAIIRSFEFPLSNWDVFGFSGIIVGSIIFMLLFIPIFLSQKRKKSFSNPTVVG